MVYIVLLIDDNYGKKYAVGFSHDYNIAEAYKDFRNSIAEKAASESNNVSQIYYDIIFMSQSKFEEFQSKNTSFFVCSEITEVEEQPGVYITDDDYEFLESNLCESVTDMNYHYRSIKNFLKLFEERDKDVEKFLKLLKVIKKRYDITTNDDNKVMQNIDFKKALLRAV